MGFRTVIIINNDRLDQVEDPVLKSAVLGWWSRDQRDRWQGPYNVIEQCHADQVTLMKLDSLQGTPMGYGSWNQKDLDLNLVKDAADRLGYRLVRKTVK
jgi:hypothetical protein